MKRPVIVFFIATILFNLLYNMTLPLHFDEAYYWVWSKHPQLSYFDHPPMIAWLIKLATISADDEWLIRLVPLGCAALTGMFIWRTAAELFDASIADRALLIFLLSPLAQIGFSLATPDAPLILGWAAALWCLQRALFGERRQYYYLAGLAAGFALLSKYTAVLLLPGALVFMLLSSYRRQLATREVWLAIGIALLLFSPVLSWNYGHEWASFQFQLNHGFASAQTINPARVFEYLGVQAVALNPLFFCVLLFVLLRSWREFLTDEKSAFLLGPCLTVLLFFAYTALFKRAEGNWAAPAYVTGIILIARWFDGCRHRNIYRAAIALGVVMILLLKLPEAFGFLPAKLVMKRQVMGYDAMFQSAGPYLAGTEQVLAADYKLASLAWYYLPANPPVQVLTPSRVSQYDYWRQDLTIKTGGDAVFFGYAEQKAALEQLFVEVSPLPPLSYSDRYIERSLQVFYCRGFKPGL